MSLSLHSVDVAVPQALPPRRYAWSVFGVAFALMVVDYVDRQVVVSMFPHLKSQWDLSDGQLGALVSVVSITVALGTVPLSLLADRWSRVRSIFLMALVWSCATIACAFAERYSHLLAARAVVGLGEAAYGSVGAALLATMFPLRMRSTVLGAFLAAGLIGSVLGIAVGGVIAERWGWQAGFGAVGVPGLLLAVLFLLVVRDYRTVALPSSSASARGASSVAAVVRELVRPRTALVACVGGALQLVMVSTTWAWMPSFFNRHYGLVPDAAGLKTAFVVLTGGIGAVVWSVIADRLSARWPRARLYVPATAALLTAGCMGTAFALLPPGSLQYPMIVAGATMMTGSVGPVAAVVVDVVHPALRSTAAAILTLTQNLFGLAVGPLLAGVLSDRFGLPFALSVVPLFSIVAAVVFAIAARTYESDLRDIEGAEPRYDAGGRAGGVNAAKTSRAAELS